MKYPIRTLLLCTSALFSFSTSALSQENISTADKSKTENETIVVTALKRQDRLEDLPVAASVTDQEAHELFYSAHPAEALTRSSPNFTFSGFGQPGMDFVNLRGIGVMGQPANSLDNTVGFSTNGMATSRLGFSPSLLDIEQVEILRGPQGTLFGRNALGGVVNLVTAPADGRREYSVHLQIGNKGHRMGEAIASDWLIEDVLAARAAIRWQKRDGEVTNVVVGGKEGGTELAAGRLSLRYLPSDDFSIDLTGSMDREEHGSTFNLLYEDPRYPVSGADRFPKNDKERIDGTLKIVKDFDSMVLTSISNFQKLNGKQQISTADNLVFDRLPYYTVPAAGANDADIDHEEMIFNQEIRLSSPESAALSWVAGANYFRSEYEGSYDQVSTYSPYASGIYNTNIISQTFAAFADVTAPVTDDLKISGGLRLSHDIQDFDSRYQGRGFPGSVTASSQTGSINDTYLTGRLAASYDITDDIMGYASISHGYASGGYPNYPINLAVGEDAEAFDPTTGWTYEAGVKNRFFDDSLMIDVSTFFNNIKNGQMLAHVVGSMPTRFSYISQDYQSYGLEIEAKAFIQDNLELRGSIGMTETRLKNIASTAPSGILKHNKVPNSANITASTGFTYNIIDNIKLSADYQYVGARFTDAQNQDKLDPYNMLSARLEWDTDWASVYAFGTNLLDETPQYYGSRYSDDTHTKVVGQGRTIGIGLKTEF